MSKAMFVFVCALVLKVTVAMGVEGAVGEPVSSQAVTTDRVFMLAENDADLFVNHASVTDESAEAATASDAVMEAPPSKPISQSAPAVIINNNSGVSEAAAVLNTKAKAAEDKTTNAAIIPMIGGSGYASRWGDHIRNSYTLGLALEFPVSRIFALEAEADYGKYRVSYGNNYQAFAHDFNLYSFGGNGKIYLLRNQIRPYIGAGVLGNYYENMSHGPSYPDRYSQLIGSGQLLVGSEYEMTEELAAGLRFSWISPLFNRAQTVHNGQNAYPYYEEAAAMDTSFYRIMATAKITF